MVSGSFDKTLKCWDASDLVVERGVNLNAGGRASGSNQCMMNLTGQKVGVFNFHLLSC